MRCGDLGHKTVHGEPCHQTVGRGKKGCIWHTRNPEQRRLLATRGALAARSRFFLPADTPPPEFRDTPSIVAWAERTAQLVMTDKLDPRAAGEARQLAALTISARQALAQEKLVEALLTVEHGGSALLLLTRLQDGLADGRRRPLPGATRALPEETP